MTPHILIYTDIGEETLFRWKYITYIHVCIGMCKLLYWRRIFIEAINEL